MDAGAGPGRELRRRGARDGQRRPREHTALHDHGGARTLRRAHRAAVPLALAAASLALACSISFAPPETQPPAAEQVAQQIEREVGTFDDPALAALVQELGRRIAVAAELPEGSLRFAIANLPENNAFSFPSGNVYVSRGLLAFVRSENELANVIAHEVAHVIGRHALRLESRKSRVRSATLGKIMTASLGGARSGEALRALELEGEGLIARYSRELEHAADREGQVLAARAGFDPAGMASFLAALDKETTFRLGRPRRPTFLDTHPAAPERAQNAAATARRLTPPPLSTRPASAFLDRLDGLLVGDDPAEGAVRDGAFLHPDLDLRIGFPPDWRVANTRGAVVAAPADGPIVLVLELQEEYHDPAAAAVRYLRAAKRTLALLDSGPFEGAGVVPAHQAAARVLRAGEPLFARIFWYAHGGRIYRLQCIGTGAGFERLGTRVEGIARSFRPLKPEERASFRVRHLRVIPALAGERFEDALARGGNVERLDQISLSNALDVGDRLAASRRVKVVVETPYPGEPPAQRGTPDP
jgi:predicted Zn-dependent protease